jgi:hypothetical protein
MAVRNSNADNQFSPNVSNEGMGNEGQQSNPVNNEKLFQNTISIPQGNVLTFGTNRLSLMQAGQGSEYTDSIAKALQAIYDASQRTVKPVIHVLDKETLKLAYSTIVVSLKSKEKATIPYFVILLEATGRKSMTAADIVNEYNNIQRLPVNNNGFQIYTADDAIDSVLNDHIVRVLTQQYGNGTFIPVDGIVIPANHEKFENFSHMLATIAYNACFTETALESNQIADLNLKIAMSELRNRRLEFVTSVNKTTVASRNEIDAPIRADWTVSLVSKDTSGTMTSLNLQHTEQQITRVAGYIDAIPEEVTINENGLVNNVIRFHPNIIVTSNSSMNPTVGFTLTGLLSANLMVKPSMWLGALRPMGKVNVGALNLIAKIDKGVGERIDLSNKKYSADEVWEVIRQMFSLQPVLSMDIEAYGPQSYYTSVFSLAANPSFDDTQKRAAQHIINTASQLTSGNFPADFPINEIFVDTGVTVPLGSYTNNHGTHDVRDIDLAYLANKTDDPAILNSWAISNVSDRISGVNPFKTKVEIINKIVPNAEITGKATRVTFTNKFITTLELAARQAGLIATFNPDVRIGSAQNLSIMASIYGNAGIQSTADYAKEYIQAGPSFATPYSNVGSFRTFY